MCLTCCSSLQQLGKVLTPGSIEFTSAVRPQLDQALSAIESAQYDFKLAIDFAQSDLALAFAPVQRVVDSVQHKQDELYSAVNAAASTALQSSLDLLGLSGLQLPLSPSAIDWSTVSDQLISKAAAIDWSAVSDQFFSNPGTLPTFLLVNVFLVLVGFGQELSLESLGSPYPAGSTSYSKDAAEDFFGSRPIFVFRRLLKLAQLTSSFQLKLLFDWRTGQLEKNEKERAAEALGLSTKCGPTVIKLAQALSLRTDLIPEAYALELRSLQDAVPAFPSNIAFKIMRDEFQVEDLSKIFKSISPEPVAAASIGQVYKAELLDGTACAIKVQRPNILTEIALDLFILRLLTPLQVRISNAVNKISTSQQDIDLAISLVDEWGRGFVAEIDYQLEATNTRIFSEAMTKRGLVSVIAPRVIDQLTRSRVLVTEWVEGTRLDRDASSDVPRLCAVAVNAYLTMLLDTGTLHCDPHPGNLLRTKDGKLCILDWGMSLQVPKDLQLAILELISHINSEDYDSIPADFVNLGFTPGDKLEQLKNSGISEGLSFALRQLNKGGGPSKIRARLKEEFSNRYGEGLSDEEIRERARAEMVESFQKQLKKEGVDVSGVTATMEAMSRRNRELFKLPPYVLYVSRAFSTLEGIGLSVDEDYSILAECFPYLARRLFSDNDPRSKSALRNMLYGGKGALDVSKLGEMVGNYQTFSTSTLTVTNDQQEAAARGLEAFQQLLFDSNGNPIQDILAEGAAQGLDSLVREGYARVTESALGQGIERGLNATKMFSDALPTPLQPLAAPLLLPYRLQTAAKVLMKLDHEDKVFVESLTALVSAVRSSSPQPDGQQRSPQSLLSMLPQLPPPTPRTLRTFAETAPAIGMNLSRKLATQILLRAAERMERTHKREGEAGENGLGGDPIALSVSESSARLAKELAERLQPVV